MGGVPDASQTSPCGVLGVACAGSRTPSDPYMSRGQFFSCLFPCLASQWGVGGPVDPGGGDDVSPLRRKTRPTESKRRGTKTTVGQGVH